MDLTGLEVHILAAALQWFIANPPSDPNEETRQFRQQLAQKISRFDLDVCLDNTQRVVLKGVLE